MSTRTLFLLVFVVGIAFMGLAQAYLFRKIYRLLKVSTFRPRVQQVCVWLLGLFFALMYLPYIARLFYRWPEHEVSALVLYGIFYPFSLWGLGSGGAFLIVLVKDIGAAFLRFGKRLWVEEDDTSLVQSSQVTRRNFLQWAFGAAAVSPVGVFAYGAAIGKERYEVVERTLIVPRLPPGLHGLRVVQLTDIHVGNFLKQDKLERYVRVVNDLKPDLVALTGDFIGSSPEFIPACATVLRKLDAKEGVFACLGNHDHWVGPRAVTEALEAIGVEVLRNAGRTLVIRGVPFNVAGIDDPWRGIVDFDRALAALDPSAPTLLLCHQPDLFPAAAKRGIELTLSGHYHGGQIKFQFLGLGFSPAHLISNFVEGLYRLGRAQLYVSRGIGVTGPPVRLNAPPEITLLRLT